MPIESTLLERANHCCELCQSTEDLRSYPVAPYTDQDADHHLLLCMICQQQIDGSETVDTHHWRCLTDCMWSQVAAVQVISYRMLKRLAAEGWTQDLLDMLYLEPEVQQWADAIQSHSDGEKQQPTFDSNGAVLQSGDTVTLIKDLVVKGANFTAKRGTAVRNIVLTDKPEQIEGRVNGVRIVLLTQYLKKSN